ncbi:hypothetical protein ABZZ47_07290 [Streptomyces sp. NPDC006465]|uniref:hypothetical protein n=1 Tax=Streptomyces sp. NPDC006465 TaxID=3157174 RepID=UPI0033A82BEF
MSGTSGVLVGRVRVRVPTADNGPVLVEPLSAAATEADGRPCPAADGRSALPATWLGKGRAPVMRTVRGFRSATRPPEGGR